MKCNNCNATLPDNAKFCLMCGTKILREHICKQCGHKLEDNARFCMLCGTPVDSIDEGLISVPSTEKYPVVGDIISYGKNSRSWIVLDVIDDKALLLTQGIVSELPYHDEWYKKITWKESSLYKWINSYFISTEFGNNELLKICTKKDGQKVFLLDVSDAEKYNAILPILSQDEKYGCDNWWWVQTSVEPTDYVPFVRPNEGRIDDYGNGASAHSNMGIRLAMWIKL